MPPELVEKIAREIPSEDSTSLEEKMILHDAILKHKPKVIVEIGSHRGMTTLYMAHAAKEVGAHIYTCDPDESWCARPNFDKFPELPVITYFPIKGKDMKIDNIDFLFIDGFHEKEYVLEEIDALFPKLTENAVVYFHDTNGSNIHCDVPGAIDEKKLKVEYLKTLNGMAVYHHGKTNKLVGARKSRG